jgi:hypothetical protein
MTVEKRAMTGVCTPGARNRSAQDRWEMSCVVSKKPLADSPRAWTTRSGMRSRSNWGEGGRGGVVKKTGRVDFFLVLTAASSLSLSLSSHVGQLLHQVIVLQQDGACGEEREGEGGG